MKNIILAISVFGNIFLLSWLYLEHPTNPQGFYYVMWKHGLIKLTPADVRTAFIGDPNGFSVIKGKNRQQVERDIGPLIMPEDARPSLREFAMEPRFAGKHVLFVYDSNLMLVFDADWRVINTIMVEG